MNKKAHKSSPRQFDKTVYILQGGGSLGAYHLGVVTGLHEHNYLPDWVIGTSIGAIHGAIIVGNKPEERISKLKQFWKTIAIPLPFDFIPGEAEETLRFKNFFSAEYATLFGLTGFFIPRFDNPLFKIDAPTTEISFYDTNPLRKTLESLIDFDLINNRKIRLSIGAVDVETGQLKYFDNEKDEIRVEHIMASSALPSGFPAIEIADKLYWDGGIYSNTPLDVIMKEKNHEIILCFIINLFNAYGSMPRNLDEIEKRKKEILFGSRYKELIELYRYVRKLKRAIEILGEKVPERVRALPDIKKLLKLGCSGTIDLVRFHRQSAKEDLSTKDYEFSQESAEKYILAGYEDVKKAVAISPWLEPLESEEIGIRVHEISKDPFDKSSAGQLCSLDEKINC